MKHEIVFLWFQRFLFCPPQLTKSYYPLFVHKLPEAKLALDVLLALADENFIIGENNNDK